jgi:tRNA threonylcarbamoyladenosine biosynthesis protein TsaE
MNVTLHEVIMPILREGELDIISYSAEQTGRLGFRLGTLLEAGDIICLSGDMGAGKTVFSSGMGKGWGALETITSPTFNLVHQHRHAQDKTILYHLDCYRLRGAQDVDSIGLDDIFDSKGIVILEWAERIQEVLPENRLWIHLRVIEDTRRNFILEASGARHQALIEKFRAVTFGF